MKTQNLYSLHHGQRVIYENSFEVDDCQRILKENEVVSIKKLCKLFEDAAAPYSVFNGYVAGYTIPQISKEFDLLRFGKDSVVNIELKGVLKSEIKHEKVLSQLKKNYYYLKFLDRKTRLFTFVEEDGLYEYLYNEGRLVKTDASEVVCALEEQDAFEQIDMDGMFKPSNYLISPFNKTEEFINGEYFLTNDQENIKKAFINGIESGEYGFYCISANAGTGKTLLVYDLAKTLINAGKRPLIIHAGRLNDGHVRLKEAHGWDIRSIGDVSYGFAEKQIADQAAIIIDEAQRVKEGQLRSVTQRAAELNIPVVFSYDVNQFLSEGEDKDLFEFVKENYPEKKAYSKELTNKIRTNKNMASFISNLMQIGKSKKDLDYRKVSVEYLDTVGEVKEYMDYLKEEKDWQTVTYTNSLYYSESIDALAELSNINAHAVIGQEFDKVALVMDKNFFYDGSGRLCFKESVYSLKGMLYQIVTRVVNELKIIVLGNPDLYDKLLYIKAMKEENCR